MRGSHLRPRRGEARCVSVAHLRPAACGRSAMAARRDALEHAACELTRPYDLLIPVGDSFLLTLQHAPAEVARRRVDAIRARLVRMTPAVGMTGTVAEIGEPGTIAEAIGSGQAASVTLDVDPLAAVSAVLAGWAADIRRRENERLAAEHADQALLQELRAEVSDARADSTLLEVELEAVRERLAALSAEQLSPRASPADALE